MTRTGPPAAAPRHPDVCDQLDPAILNTGATLFGYAQGGRPRSSKLSATRFRKSHVKGAFQRHRRSKPYSRTFQSACRSTELEHRFQKRLDGRLGRDGIVAQVRPAFDASVFVGGGPFVSA